MEKQKTKTLCKKSISLLLALLLVVTAIPLGGLTAFAETSGDFEYEIYSETTCAIIEYIGSESNLTIPSQIDGYTVTDIGVGAFSNCTSLESLTLPDTVSYIAEGAFENCTSLRSVSFPENIRIFYHAFYGCISLKSITIPDDIGYIDSSAFLNTAYYNSEENWKNGVLYIGNHLIKARENIKGTYTIKDGARTITESAFEGCTSLTNIIIPGSVTYIGNSAFKHCTSLTSVTIFNGTTDIAAYAFDSCTSLTNIKLPDSVIHVGSMAFYNTEYYNNTTNWENSVLYVGHHLIEAKGSIGETYIIKTGTQTIADQSFFGCDLLKSITIPNSVTNIGDDAFRLCIALTDITIPDGVISIGTCSFMDTALKNVAIPSSVTSIGDYAFGYYSDLGYKKIANFTIQGYTGTAAETYAKTNGFNFIALNAKPEESVQFTYNVLEDGTIEITGSEKDLSLHPHLIIPAVYDGYTVSAVGSGAFYGHTEITALTVEDGVKIIGDSAFANCRNLSEIHLPDSIEDLITTLPDMHPCGSFWDTAYVNNRENYAEDGNLYFGNIAYTANGDENGNIAYREGTVTIAGDLWNSEGVKSVYIPRSVQHINEFAYWAHFDETTEEYIQATIYGYAGSYAEVWAKEHKHPFVAVIGRDITSDVMITETNNNSTSVPSDAQLSVQLTESTQDKTVYNISLLQNGTPIQPAAPVTVKIPVPATMNGADCKVYRQEADGTYTDMQAVYKNGYMVFTTDHFSIYILTVKDLNAPEIAMGDLNNDGQITAVDARWALQAASGTRPLSDEQIQIADVNGDGQVTAVDARWILQAASGTRVL